MVLLGCFRDFSAGPNNCQITLDDAVYFWPQGEKGRIVVLSYKNQLSLPLPEFPALYCPIDLEKSQVPFSNI